MVLREEGRSGTAGRGARTLRRTLVVAQVAFAFVLLIGAGLLFASFREVLAVDPGFNPDNVLTASISLPRSRYTEDKAFVGFTNARNGIALPSVAGGRHRPIPFGGNNNDSVILAEGYQMKPGESVFRPTPSMSPRATSRRCMRLVAGRFIDERDGYDALKVIMVDRRSRASAEPELIGRRIYSRPTTWWRSTTRRCFSP
jgi:putative ABC transport system permease protein